MTSVVSCILIGLFVPYIILGTLIPFIKKMLKRCNVIDDKPTTTWHELYEMYPKYQWKVLFVVYVCLIFAFKSIITNPSALQLKRVATITEWINAKNIKVPVAVLVVLMSCLFYYYHYIWCRLCISDQDKCTTAGWYLICCSIQAITTLVGSSVIYHILFNNLFMDHPSLMLFCFSIITICGVISFTKYFPTTHRLVFQVIKFSKLTSDQIQALVYGESVTGERMAVKENTDEKYKRKPEWKRILSRLEEHNQGIEEAVFLQKQNWLRTQCDQFHTFIKIMLNYKSTEAIAEDIIFICNAVHIGFQYKRFLRVTKCTNTLEKHPFTMALRDKVYKKNDKLLHHLASLLNYKNLDEQKTQEIYFGSLISDTFKKSYIFRDFEKTSIIEQSQFEKAKQVMTAKDLNRFGYGFGHFDYWCCDRSVDERKKYVGWIIISIILIIMPVVVYCFF
jgi:hypothetical protein